MVPQWIEHLIPFLFTTYVILLYVVPKVRRKRVRKSLELRGPDGFRREYDAEYTKLLEHDSTAGFRMVMPLGLDPDHCEMCYRESKNETPLTSKVIRGMKKLAYENTETGFKRYGKYGRDHWAGCPCAVCMGEYALHNAHVSCHCDSCKMHRSI